MNKLLTSIILFCFSVAVIAQENPRILSVYHGLDPIPPGATALCGMAPVTGQEGMPVTFSVQIDSETVSPTAFAVETSDKNLVTPICATLRPALEALEQRTILLIGAFSSGDSIPIGVKIVEQLKDVAGNSLAGLRSEKVTPLAAGPSLVFAERFAPETRGLERECPEETAQAILLTWEGGVTGPQGADLADAQRTAVSVVLANDDHVNPLSLGDDDKNNHVIARKSETRPAVSINVLAGFFYDPGDDSNPVTSIDIVEGRL